LIIQYQDGGDVTSNDDTVDLPSTDDASQDKELVNINTASLEELNALPGIGPTTAQKIIDYRTENGEYSIIEDIMNVSGIGPATFEEIKDLITT
jgi:competence protein ComEA